jgi:hypothetical protein
MSKMFKITTALVFIVTPVLALVLALTAGLVPALVVLFGLPVVSIAVLVARLALTRSGQDAASTLQTRRDGLRESLR